MNKQTLKPYRINLINAIVLLVMGGLGILYAKYIDGASTSGTVPLAFGLVFAASTPIFRQGNKIVRYLIVAFTVLLLIALIPPFLEAMDKQETWNALRIGLMLLAGLAASLVYGWRFLRGEEVKR